MASARIPFHIFLGRLFISFAGATLLMIAAFIGTQVGLGNVKKSDLQQMLFVLRGHKRYTMSANEIAELQAFREEKAALEAQMTIDEGSLETRREAATSLRRTMEMQRENFEVLKRQLESEQAKLSELTSRYTQLKEEYEDARKLHTDVRKQDEEVDTARQSEELMRTLVNMDAGDIATFLEGYMANNKPDAAADYLSRYTRPDFRAEVLTEMTAAGRQKILPLLANRYAGLTPEQVLERWQKEENLSPEQMHFRMLQMPVSQSFGVYFGLNPGVRAKLARLLQ